MTCGRHVPFEAVAWGRACLLGVWPHPDDEMYLSAGIMTAAIEARSRVVMVTATRGEHSTDDRCTGHPASRATAGCGSRPRALAGGTGRIGHHFLGDATGSCHLDGTLAHGRRWTATPTCSRSSPRTGNWRSS